MSFPFANQAFLPFESLTGHDKLVPGTLLGSSGKIWNRALSMQRFLILVFSEVCK